MTAPRPWRVSLHGGHSGNYCEHADGSLHEIVEAAIAAGFQTYGLSEHAPRLGSRWLYTEERAMGWDVVTLERQFEAFAIDTLGLAEDYADRIVVLRGFETEAVPSDCFVEAMSAYRAEHGFDYVVGSVHHVADIQIDGSELNYARAIDAHGGLESLAAAYYETVTDLIDGLRPEVVGHIDLIRKKAAAFGRVDTPRIRLAAERALEAALACDCVLDVNTAGYRKGLGAPYPEPWLIEMASRMGLGFCFGDDSHGPEQVGAGVDDARSYLLGLGVDEVTVLTRHEGALVRRQVSLSDDP